MAGQRLAYVRVSSDGQNTSRQDQVIAEKNVDKIFTEKVSGRNISDRPQFLLMLEYARDQDIIYCADLSRWGRSMVDIRTTITYLTKKGVTIEFIKENLTFSNKNDDTSNLLLGILSSLSEWERAVIKSRQMEGVRIAQERGIYKERCGRKPKLTEEQIEEVIRRVNAGENRTSIAESMKVSRQTIYNVAPRRLVKDTDA
jgi:DNA invertase Pin-like site-specific DNA recombinase